MLKIIWTVLLILILLTQYRLWAGEGSIEQVISLKKTVADQEIINKKLALRNSVLAEKVNALKQGGDAIEAKARKDLGMIKEGETFFMVFDEKNNNP